jgi:hypothetical protein
MRILALVAEGERAESIRGRYGVPVYGSREALVSDYPPQDYSGLVDVDEGNEVMPSLTIAMATMAKASEDMAKAFEDVMAKVRQAITVVEEDSWIGPQDDRRARALESRRNRSTGPETDRPWDRGGVR